MAPASMTNQCAAMCWCTFVVLLLLLFKALFIALSKTGLEFPVTPDWASLDHGHQTWCIRDTFNGKSMPWTMVMCQSCYSTQYLIFFFFCQLYWSCWLVPGTYVIYCFISAFTHWNNIFFYTCVYLKNCTKLFIATEKKEVNFIFLFCVLHIIINQEHFGSSIIQ